MVGAKARADDEGVEGRLKHMAICSSNRIVTIGTQHSIQNSRTACKIHLATDNFMNSPLRW